MRTIITFILVSYVFGGYGGGYAGSGFRYGSSAREMALAGAVVAESNSAFQQFSNPSLLSQINSSQLGLSYFMMSLDRSIQVFSFVKPLPPKGGIAISLFRSGVSNINETNSNNEFISSISSSEMFGMLSFGVSFSKYFSIGINLRALLNQLTEDYDSKSISMDIGFRLFISESFQMGISGKNLIGFYQWKIDTDRDGSPSDYSEVFPKIYSVGGRYKINKTFKLLGQIDMVSPSKVDVSYRFRIGMEYYYKQKLNLRLGVKQRYDLLYADEKNKINFVPSFGLGIPFSKLRDKSVIFNYAIDIGMEGEGMSHLFTWSLEW